MSAALWWLAGAGGVFLLSRKGGMGVPMVRSDQASANGVGPNGTNASSLQDAFNNGYGPGSSSLGGPLDKAFGLGAKVDQAVATGICTYYTGGAGAPACAAAGKVVSSVNEFQRKTTIKAAKYIFKKAEPVVAAVGGEIKAGAKALPSVVRSAVTTPVGFAGSAMELSGNLTAKAASSLDRVTQQAYGKLPTPLKLAAAPVLFTEKLGSKIIGGTNSAINKGVDVAKGVEKKAENVGKKVANFIGGLF